MNHYLGPLIRQIRLARGIGLNELARNAGFVDRGSHLSNYERSLKGGLREPDCLYPLAAALKTSVPALFVMREICEAEPSIMGAPDLLLERLSRVESEINRLFTRAA